VGKNIKASKNILPASRQKYKRIKKKICDWRRMSGVKEKSRRRGRRRRRRAMGC